MRCRLSFLLLLCFGLAVRVSHAQENVQEPKEPPAPATQGSCSHIPDPDTDSDDYNKGFRAGYRAGCKSAEQASDSAEPPTATGERTSGIHLDEAVGDTPAPREALNSQLLREIRSACPAAANTALTQAGKPGHNLTWNIKYRVQILAALYQNPDSCAS